MREEVGVGVGAGILSENTGLLVYSLSHHCKYIIDNICRYDFSFNTI